MLGITTYATDMTGAAERTHNVPAAHFSAAATDAGTRTRIAIMILV